MTMSGPSSRGKSTKSILDGRVQQTLAFANLAQNYHFLKTLWQEMISD